MAVWFLYKVPPEYDTGARFDRRIRSCLDIWHNVESDNFQCEFLTSEWAMLELVRVLTDDKIAIKILRSGHSLTHFGKFKHQYQLTESERKELTVLLRSYRVELEQHRIRILPVGGTTDSLTSRIMRYDLETGDLLNVESAIRRCKYFLTNDGELERKKEIAGLKLVLPDTFLAESKRNGLMKK